MASRMSVSRTDDLNGILLSDGGCNEWEIDPHEHRRGWLVIRAPMIEVRRINDHVIAVRSCGHIGDMIKHGDGEDGDIDFVRRTDLVGDLKAVIG